MTDIIDRALPLWAGPLPPGDEGLEAFRLVYTDPVLVNGELTPLSSLVDRARMMQRALTDVRHDVLQRVDSPDRVAFAFRISARHTGPLETPIGLVPPSGRSVRLLGLDVFELTADLVRAVWAVSDQLGLLVQAGALGEREASAG